MDRPSQAKPRWPAPRHLVAIFVLVYLAGWGYWLSLYTQTPSRKCSARLDGLTVDANLAYLNHARRAAYDSLEAHLSSEGLNLGKEQTQGLDARTLFHMRDGRIEPGLQPLEVPVRAVVAPLGDSQATARLASAVRAHIVPVAAEAGVWLQDPKKYHSTLFHASSHSHPVKASTAQIATETASVSKTAMALCPLEIVLERVVVTATGNVVACWQVAAGSDPSEIRRALERALPNAPPRRYQTVQEPTILHTTLARLVELQGHSTGRILRSGGLDQAAELQSAAGRMTQALCGLASTLRSLWYVQEDDLLALALNGRSRHQEVPPLCQKPPPSLKGNVKSVHDPPPVIRDESYLERASQQG